jgi:hypothetical protein
MAAAADEQVINWLTVAPGAPANTVAWAAHGLVALACQNQAVLLVRAPSPRPCGDALPGGARCTPGSAPQTAAWHLYPGSRPF